MSAVADDIFNQKSIGRLEGWRFVDSANESLFYGHLGAQDQQVFISFDHISTNQLENEHNFFALLILPVLCVTGLIGNIMVCIAIWTERRLHNVTNYFLFSLALADLFVCTIVMPLAILAEVKQGVWTWSFGLCLIYTYADVFLCSASIVHISVISLDRYLGISRPLKVRNKSRTIVTLKICFVWIMTIIISCPLAALALIEPNTILQDNVCTIRSRQYMIYGSTLSFLIPMIIMTITFAKTTQLLNKQANALSQRKNGVGFHNGLRRTVMQHRKQGDRLINMHNSSQTSISRKIFSNTSTQISPLAQRYPNNTQRPTRTISLDTDEDDSPDNDPPATAPVPGHKNSHIKEKFGRVRTQLMTFTRRSQRNINSKGNVELANEHKASRVLAVVFACFFTCWAPFFIMNFTLGFCGDHCAAPSWMASVILWLGYLSSTLNPIIYTIFNRRFREAFLRIIHCQCCSPRETSYTRSHAFLTGDATWSCVDRSVLIQNNRDSTTGPHSPHSNGIAFKKNALKMTRTKLSDTLSVTSKIMHSAESLSTLKKRGSTDRQRHSWTLSMDQYLTRSSSATLACDGNPLHDFETKVTTRRFSLGVPFPSAYDKGNSQCGGATVMTVKIIPPPNEADESQENSTFRSKSFTIDELIPNIDDDIDE